MSGTHQAALKYQDGWLSADFPEGRLEILLWPVPTARIQSLTGKEGHRIAQALAQRLMSTLPLPLPMTWSYAPDGSQRILDPSAYYAETFSPACRSNDALREAFAPMPDDVLEKFYQAPKGSRWQWLQRMANEYGAEYAMVAEAAPEGKWIHPS